MKVHTHLLMTKLETKQKKYDTTLIGNGNFTMTCTDESIVYLKPSTVEKILSQKKHSGNEAHKRIHVLSQTQTGNIDRASKLHLYYQSTYKAAPRKTSSANGVQDKHIPTPPPPPPPQNVVATYAQSTVGLLRTSPKERVKGICAKMG